MVTPIQQLTADLFEAQQVQVFVKRDDLTDPLISGNKWRKLQFNIQEILKTPHKRVLTFGGAFSNHIAAVAAAAHQHQFEAIGIIRGERPEPLNPTLQQAQAHGMNLHFVDRATYRNKYEATNMKIWRKQFGDFFCLPEGGTNQLAVKGCIEVISELQQQLGTLPDYICLSAGTGGTASGFIIGATDKATRIEVFPALKGDFIAKDIQALMSSHSENHIYNWDLCLDYHFGGYAKFNQALIDFMNDFKVNHGIELDPIYTGKLFFGVLDRIKEGQYPANSSILLYHSGGLQGRKGFESRFGPLLH